MPSSQASSISALQAKIKAVQRGQAQAKKDPISRPPAQGNNFSVAFSQPDSEANSSQQ